MYQDPEGTRSLEQTNYIDPTNNKTIDAVDDSSDDSYYKSRIISLNTEIAALNKRNKALCDELTMVRMYAFNILTVCS